MEGFTLDLLSRKNYIVFGSLLKNVRHPRETRKLGSPFKNLGKWSDFCLGNFSWTHWRLRHVACIIFSRPFFMQRKECGGFPQNPVTSSCYVGKPGQPYFTSPKDIIMFGGELIDKPPRRFFFRRGNGGVVFTTGGWQLSIEKEEDSSLCVWGDVNRVRNGSYESQKSLWKLLSKLKSHILPRGSYDLNNVSYGTGSGKLSGLTLTWQQQQMQSRRREKEIMTRGNRQFLLKKTLKLQEATY